MNIHIATGQSEGKKRCLTKIEPPVHASLTPKYQFVMLEYKLFELRKEFWKNGPHLYQHDDQLWEILRVDDQCTLRTSSSKDSMNYKVLTRVESRFVTFSEKFEEGPLHDIKCYQGGNADSVWNLRYCLYTPDFLKRTFSNFSYKVT